MPKVNTPMAPIYAINKAFYDLADYSDDADPTGVVDATGAFKSALAAMPKVTVFATPSTNGGASATYPVGTILLRDGTYKIGTSGDIGNIGPFVSIIGPGHACCKLDYRGSGDCIRQFNAVAPSSVTFDTLAAWAGRLDGFLIDGTHAGAGANGLHYGDMEGGSLGSDLYIFNFSGAGSRGLYLDNSVSWTENTWGRVVISNCTNAVVFDVSGASANNSFEYNDLLFKVYCYANQNGVVLQNGANYANGSLRILGNFAMSGSAQSNACLTVTGRQGASGQYTQIAYSRLDVQVETDLGGGNAPQTINYGGPSTNAIAQCVGVLSFGGTWTASNWTVASAFAAATFLFAGVILGDANLAPNGASGLTLAGGVVYGASMMFSDGGTPLAQGDFFSYVLTANLVIAFQRNVGGPQRKTILIKQAASGGPFTVTWPKPGSPSVSTPAVYWAGGTAPTMTATANAQDKYVIETIDGVRWYGSAAQNLS